MQSSENNLGEKPTNRKFEDNMNLIIHITDIRNICLTLQKIIVSEMNLIISVPMVKLKSF